MSWDFPTKTCWTSSLSLGESTDRRASQSLKNRSLIALYVLPWMITNTKIITSQEVAIQLIGLCRNYAIEHSRRSFNSNLISCAANKGSFRTRIPQSLVAAASYTGEYPGAELRRSSADDESTKAETWCARVYTIQRSGLCSIQTWPDGKLTARVCALLYIRSQQRRPLDVGLHAQDFDNLTITNVHDFNEDPNIYPSLTTNSSKAPPTCIAKTQKSISERSNWKASEWLIWLYYSLPCLEGLYPRKYSNHLALFVWGRLGWSISPQSFQSQRYRHLRGRLPGQRRRIRQVAGTVTVHRRMHRDPC
ncbi:unnamed protein product [Trichogramma brassicae]|uniref:Uncharacterized protein n=1 Tax=Trichogramma brassicae TaxID=86971 RepID=A0A6H5IGH3_9HYME|nr:unnamed protein product [Trichogramma brassicae]